MADRCGVLTLGNDGKYMLGPAPTMQNLDDAYSRNTRAPPQYQQQQPQYNHGADPSPRRRNVNQTQSDGQSSDSNTQMGQERSPDNASSGSSTKKNADNEADGSTELVPPVEDEHDDKENGKDERENEQEDEDEEDGGEKGGDKSPPKPVGFWDPKLAHVRKEAVSKWALTTVVLMVFILAVLSIYWATLYKVEQNIHKLTIAVVDFDGQAPYNTNTPIVGPAITQLTSQTAAMPAQLGYITLPASDFNNDPIQVWQAVYNFEHWAAIIINANATSMLYSAIQSGNASYDPLGACQLVFTDSRDDTNWYDFIYPLLSMLLTQIASSVGQQWATTALQMASTDATVLANLQTVPQAISPAIGFSMYNLRPFYPYQTIPAVSVGLIYLIIISFFSFSFYLPIHVKYLKPEGHPPLKFYQLVIWRWIATMVAYLFLSLAYSFLSLAFQINFSGTNPAKSDTTPSQIMYGNDPAYGYGTFPVYWMLNYVGMIALGLACENVAMIAGQPWTGLWLIFWVITNVSTAFYDITIEPIFYRWGYAWPLHNIVEGSRQIIFGLHSRIGLNFGILFAWCAINTALFPLCCMFMRYKTRHNLHEYWA